MKKIINYKKYAQRQLELSETGLVEVKKKITIGMRLSIVRKMENIFSMTKEECALIIIQHSGLTMIASMVIGKN